MTVCNNKLLALAILALNAARPEFIASRGSPSRSPDPERVVVRNDQGSPQVKWSGRSNRASLYVDWHEEDWVRVGQALRRTGKVRQEVMMPHSVSSSQFIRQQAGRCINYRPCAAYVSFSFPTVSLSTYLCNSNKNNFYGKLVCRLGVNYITINYKSINESISLLFLLRTRCG